MANLAISRPGSPTPTELPAVPLPGALPSITGACGDSDEGLLVKMLRRPRFQPTDRMGRMLAHSWESECVYSAISGEALSHACSWTWGRMYSAIERIQIVESLGKNVALAFRFEQSQMQAWPPVEGLRIL